MNRIVGLQAENVKRIKAVSIQPNGSPMVVIGGNNGQGKTSTIDAIEIALCGGKHIPPKPVRDGADSARIVVETEDLVVTRTINPDRTSSLVVTSKDGKKYSSPQKILDTLVGSLSFDPLEFTRMKSDKQEQTLRELLGIDTSKLDLARSVAYESRTLANREVKTLEAQLDQMKFHGDAPAQELSTQEVQDALNDAIAHNKRVSQLDANLAEIDREIDGYEADIKKCDAEIERLKALLNAESGKKIKLKATLLKTNEARDQAYKEACQVQEINEQEIVAKLATIGEENRKIAENTAYHAHVKRFEEKQAEAAGHSKQIDAIDAKKRKMLAEASYPIPELSISPEGGVMLSGQPLEQASAAESLRASMAIAIAMNPGFPVALIRDGSLLDENSLRLVEEMAAEKGCQVWVERVGEGEECSVIISEGMIKTNRLKHAMNGAELAPAK
jgi:DNA repair exonuclease SbcCD ATPase subunit